MNMKQRKVVITGLGVISPNGIGKDAVWTAMSNGRSAVREVDDFDVSQFRSRIAGEVRDFDPLSRGLTQTDVMRLDRYVQFALVATDMALQDGRVDLADLDRERVGVSLANAICGTKYMDEEFALVTDDGRGPIDPSLVRPDLYDAAMFNTPSAEIAAKYGLHGVCCTISTGCTGGSDSLGFGLESIRDGEHDLMVCGAAEAPITPITFGAFDVVNVLSSQNDHPEGASRPFDGGRDGFVLAEGAGVLLLEELQHALRRGAPIYAEVAGFGSTCNAFHMTDLPADGAPMADCIELALADAGLSPQAVDYVNAHGSSTKMNDIFETNAYKLVFGARAPEVPISSLKSMIGHPLAAANAIELAVACQIFERHLLPPTINQAQPDRLCDLDYVPNRARACQPATILKTSSGFSGIHSSLVLRRYDA